MTISNRHLFLVLAVGAVGCGRSEPVNRSAPTHLEFQGCNPLWTPNGCLRTDLTPEQNPECFPTPGVDAGSGDAGPGDTPDAGLWWNGDAGAWNWHEQEWAIPESCLIPDGQDGCEPCDGEAATEAIVGAWDGSFDPPAPQAFTGTGGMLLSKLDQGISAGDLAAIEAALPEEEAIDLETNVPPSPGPDGTPGDNDLIIYSSGFMRECHEVDFFIEAGRLAENDVFSISDAKGNVLLEEVGPLDDLGAFWTGELPHSERYTVRLQVNNDWPLSTPLEQMSGAVRVVKAVTSAAAGTECSRVTRLNPWTAVVVTTDHAMIADTFGEYTIESAVSPVPHSFPLGSTHEFIERTQMGVAHQDWLTDPRYVDYTEGQTNHTMEAEFGSATAIGHPNIKVWIVDSYLSQDEGSHIKVPDQVRYGCVSETRGSQVTSYGCKLAPNPQENVSAFGPAWDDPTNGFFHASWVASRIFGQDGGSCTQGGTCTSFGGIGQANSRNHIVFKLDFQSLSKDNFLPTVENSISAVIGGLSELLAEIDANGGDPTGLVDVINMSLGLPFESEALQLVMSELAARGVAIITSTGNEDQEAHERLRTGIWASTVAIGSVGSARQATFGGPLNTINFSHLNERSYFVDQREPHQFAPGQRSNQGADFVTNGANTTGGWLPSGSGGFDYGVIVNTGTSYATADFTGIYASLLALHREIIQHTEFMALSAREQRDLILSAIEFTAKDLGPPGYDDDFGYGVPRAYDAHRMIERLLAPDPNDVLVPHKREWDISQGTMPTAEQRIEKRGRTGIVLDAGMKKTLLQGGSCFDCFFDFVKGIVYPTIPFTDIPMPLDLPLIGHSSTVASLLISSILKPCRRTVEEPRLEYQSRDASYGNRVWQGTGTNQLQWRSTHTQEATLVIDGTVQNLWSCIPLADFVFPTGFSYTLTRKFQPTTAATQTTTWLFENRGFVETGNDHNKPMYGLGPINVKTQFMGTNPISMVLNLVFAVLPIFDSMLTFLANLPPVQKRFEAVERVMNTHFTGVVDGSMREQLREALNIGQRFERSRPLANFSARFSHLASQRSWDQPNLFTLGFAPPSLGRAYAQYALDGSSGRMFAQQDMTLYLPSLAAPPGAGAHTSAPPYLEPNDPSFDNVATADTSSYTNPVPIWSWALNEMDKARLPDPSGNNINYGGLFDVPRISVTTSTRDFSDVRVELRNIRTVSRAYVDMSSTVPLTGAAAAGNYGLLTMEFSVEQATCLPDESGGANQVWPERSPPLPREPIAAPACDVNQPGYNVIYRIPISENDVVRRSAGFVKVQSEDGAIFHDLARLDTDNVEITFHESLGPGAPTCNPDRTCQNAGDVCDPQGFCRAPKQLDPCQYGLRTASMARLLEARHLPRIVRNAQALGSIETWDRVSGGHQPWRTLRGLFRMFPIYLEEKVVSISYALGPNLSFSGPVEEYPVRNRTRRESGLSSEAPAFRFDWKWTADTWVPQALPGSAMSPSGTGANDEIQVRSMIYSQSPTAGTPAAQCPQTWSGDRERHSAYLLPLANAGRTHDDIYHHRYELGSYTGTVFVQDEWLLAVAEDPGLRAIYMPEYDPAVHKLVWVPRDDAPPPEGMVRDDTKCESDPTLDTYHPGCLLALDPQWVVGQLTGQQWQTDATSLETVLLERSHPTLDVADGCVPRGRVFFNYYRWLPPSGYAPGAGMPPAGTTWAHVYLYDEVTDYTYTEIDLADRHVHGPCAGAALDKRYYYQSVLSAVPNPSVSGGDGDCPPDDSCGGDGGGDCVTICDDESGTCEIVCGGDGGCPPDDPHCGDGAGEDIVDVSGDGSRDESTVKLKGR